MGEDMTLPRLYYTLPELAEEWKKRESDLLHMAATGALQLSVKHYGAGHYLDEDNADVDVIIDGYVQLESDDCETLIEFGLKGSGLIRSVWWQDKRVYITDRYQLEKDIIRHALQMEFGVDAAYMLEDEVFQKKGIRKGVPANQLFVRDLDDLLIIPDEASRVEDLYPELLRKSVGKTVNRHSDVGQIDDWITGKEKLCKAFGVGKNSFTSVRNKVKAAGMEFDYDPKTKEIRLLAVDVVKILAGINK